jgi:putative two-component system response regulator
MAIREVTMRNRILFVDDEPMVLTALSRMLEGQRHAWEMAFVPSAEQALARAQEVQFDAIVLDISLGSTNGLQLLQALQERERTRNVPVVFLTGIGEQDLKRRALELGAADLLSKPVRAEELIARLRNVLRLKAYQDELRSLNDGLQHKVEERTRELEESHLDTIWRLAKAGEYRDDDTGNHVMRVGRYGRAACEALGMPRERVERTFVASLLHDIGKIGIPDAVLLKPGGLTPAERRTMEQHCEIGARILREAPNGLAPFLASRGIRPYPNQTAHINPIKTLASSIALTHHERWDGRGYPAGLAGEDIPLEARVTALADVYDALCSDRPYRRAYPEARALAIIREEGEAHFGPDVFAAFNALMDEFRAIRAELSDTPQHPAPAPATSPDPILDPLPRVPNPAGG